MGTLDPSLLINQPAAGAPVQAQWGRAVAEAVVQKFATAAERDSKWTSPPVGSLCTIADQPGLLFMRKTAGWIICTPRTYDQQKAWAAAT